jgi:histidinol-phosphate phosphatase family protein
MFDQIQAIFIDRDGTIGGGAEGVEYPGELRLYSNVLTSIGLLKEAGKLVFSFTNQPGISKGLATITSFENELVDFGFDKVYLCPHEHGEGCKCRKPSIGMLTKAASEYALSLKKCVVIGDRWTDMLAAEEAGCIKILVKTGAGMESYLKYKNHEYFGRWAEVKVNYIAEDFEDAVKWLRGAEESEQICKE